MKLEDNPSPTKECTIIGSYKININPTKDWTRQTEITVTPMKNYKLVKLIATVHFLDYSNTGGGGFFPSMPDDAQEDFEIPIVDNKAVFTPNLLIASADKVELEATVEELPVVDKIFRFQLSLTNTTINHKIEIPDINPFALIGEKETIILKSDEGMEFVKPIEIELYDVEKNLVKSFEYNPNDSVKFSEDKTEFNITVAELLEEGVEYGS